MLRTTLIVAGLLALAVAAPAPVRSNPAPTAAPAPVTVEIKGHTYNPDPLIIPAGTPVVFHNGTTDMHSATSDAGSSFSFDTAIFRPGHTSAPIVFPASAGTVHYHCSVEGLSMKGTIIVKP